MGIIRAFTSSIPNLFEEQWKEYFYCNSLGYDLLIQRGRKHVGERSTNTRMDDQVITNGSLIVVNAGQAVVVTSMGKVIDVCTEPGEHIFQDPNRTSGVSQFFKDAAERFTYGGGDIQPVVHRLYYVNMLESMGNKFETTAPIPVRIKDPSSGLDMDGALMVSGIYSYRVKDAVKFYKLVVGNISGNYYRSALNLTIQNQILSCLNQTVSLLSSEGMRPSDFSKETERIGEALIRVMNEGWMGEHGLEMSSVAVYTVTLEDLRMVQNAQRTAMLKDPSMAAATLIGAQADSMRIAAGNPHGAGLGMAFVRPDLAPKSNSDMVAYLRGQGAKPVPKSSDSFWICSCGTKNTGRFCTECGRKA